jgi:hypothetical protein
MKRYFVLVLILFLLEPILAEEVYDLEWTYITEGEVRNISLMGRTIIFSSGAYEGFPGEYTDNKIYAFTLSGEKLWEKEVSHLITTIQIGKNIYFSSGRYLYCYDSSFSEVWHYSTNAEITTFFLSGNEIYLILEDGTMKFLDECGEEKWERTIDSGIFLTYESGVAYAGYYLQPYIYFLDPTGTVVWTYKTVEHTEKLYVDDFDGDDEPEILTSYYKFIYLTNKHGLVEWSFRADEYINDVYIADKIYVIAGKNLYVLSKKGELEEEKEFEDQVTLVVPEDIDNNGEKEILLAMARWDKNTQEWTDHYLYIGKRVQDTRGAIRSILCIDSDMDGDKELILGANDLFFLKNDILEVRAVLSEQYEQTLIIYEQKEFQRAKEEFLILKEEYIDAALDTTSIDEMLSKIESYENGYKLYNAAEQALDEKNYTAAKTGYENARRYFEEVNDTAIISDIDNKIAFCEEKIAEETETPEPEPEMMDRLKEYLTGKFMVLWIGVITALIALIILMKRRKKV